MGVVLVDDDRRFRAKAREAEGVEVLAEIASGKDALAGVENCSSDVVLIDVRMPDVDGLEVARRFNAVAAPVLPHGLLTLST